MIRSIFLLLLLCGTIDGLTQIVNIEDKRVERSDTIDWNGRIDLGVNMVENGSSVLTLKGGLMLEHTRYRSWWLLLSRYNLVQVESEDFVNDGFQHLRYNYRLHPRLTFEAFTQTQYNERLSLRLRWLLGSGLRFRLTNSDTQQAFVGIAYMYEYNEENKPEEIYFRDHRMSSYISFNLRWKDNIRVAGTSYYQPVFNNFADLRLSSKTSLIFTITSRLRITTTFNITHDTRVPEGVANTIYGLSNGLRLEF